MREFGTVVAFLALLGACVGIVLGQDALPTPSPTAPPPPHTATLGDRELKSEIVKEVRNEVVTAFRLEYLLVGTFVGVFGFIGFRYMVRGMISQQTDKVAEAVGRAMKAAEDAEGRLDAVSKAIREFGGEAESRFAALRLSVESLEVARTTIDKGFVALNDRLQEAKRSLEADTKLAMANADARMETIEAKISLLASGVSESQRSEESIRRELEELKTKATARMSAFNTNSVFTVEVVGFKEPRPGQVELIATLREQGYRVTEAFWDIGELPRSSVDVEHTADASQQAKEIGTQVEEKIGATVSTKTKEGERALTVLL